MNIKCSNIASIIALILVINTVTFAQTANYGSTNFPNSGAAAAQPAFLKGLLALHSFEYEDAREAFQEAENIDPDFALAYWGEAMSYNHPIWMEQDTDAARAALEKLGKTAEKRLAKAPTAREKDYLRTAEVLFFSAGDKEARDFAFEKSMAELAAKYPNDLDAATLHALSILGTCHEGRDFRRYMKAAAIAEEVFAKNPNHPGAAHCMIHSYDDPIHAPLGLRSARVYAKIAPAAAHALHMPSHIFFALGMWDAVSASNEDSYAAAKARTDRRGEVLNGHGYHALGWLEYSYLQQGRFAEAQKLLDKSAMHLQASGQSNRAKNHTVFTRTTFINETQNWDEQLLLPEFESWQINGRTAARYWFTKARIYLKNSQLENAEKALDHLAEIAVEQPDDKALNALHLELMALIALQKDDAAQALEHLKTAAELEDKLPLSFGPPWPLKPTHELYGEVLLQLNRPAEAAAQFQKALDRAPRRSLSLLGLARAALQAEDFQSARAAAGELQKSWHNADTNLKQLPEIQSIIKRTSGNSE